jgi:hypothetical protein
MHEAILFLLRETTSKLIEVVVDRAFERRPDAVGAPAPVDPVSEAQGVVDAFLSALRDRDPESMAFLCDPSWGGHPGTAALMDATLAAAPPVSWHFRTLHVPGDWSSGDELAWLVADLVVTFDVGGGGYETIPAGMRAVNGVDGWRIDWLEWGAAEASPMEEQPVAISESLSDFFDLQYLPAGDEIVTCARCEQQLRVPTDKGRLRVTCPKCKNSQWYQP